MSKSLRRAYGRVELVADRLWNTRGQPIWSWNVLLDGHQVGCAWNRAHADIAPAKGEEWRGIICRVTPDRPHLWATPGRVGDFPSPEAAATAVLGEMLASAKTLFVGATGANQAEVVRPAGWDKLSETVNKWIQEELTRCPQCVALGAERCDHLESIPCAAGIRGTEPCSYELCPPGVGCRRARAGRGELP